ncbi:MAG: imidazoleglycerol-phosphate dehydratase [Candidatus Omnitrophica bacterium]|nr:imidazoleglycerol-phosphate dehydratase [Candidatus Omnitrophota bacterium]
MGIFCKKVTPEIKIGARKTEYERNSKETQIKIESLNIDGKGKASIATTIGFLDHMLTLLAYHGFFDIDLRASGDTHVDKHHLNEDLGIALGEAFKKALGDSKGIKRTAWAEVPMDMVSAKVLVDLSNRFAFKVSVPGKIDFSGTKEEEGYSFHYAKDFLESFAKKMCINLHIAISGDDGDMHHYLEAVFKALGMALDEATRLDGRRAGDVPSSKGIL